MWSIHELTLIIVGGKPQENKSNILKVVDMLNPFKKEEKQDLGNSENDDNYDTAWGRTPLKKDGDV